LVAKALGRGGTTRTREARFPEPLARNALYPYLYIGFDSSLFELLAIRPLSEHVSRVAYRIRFVKTRLASADAAEEIACAGAAGR
jgi:hypothetical protein